MKEPQAFLASIKVVGFDFDQTLVDEAFSLRKRWVAVLAEYPHLSPHLSKVFLRLYDEKGHKYKTHLNEAFAELGISEEHLMPIVEKFRASRSDEEKKYAYTDDVIYFFKQRGVRVGIITDGKQNYQEGRLKIAGLYDLFDFFYYGDNGQKPDPAFFNLVIQEEGVKPYELLYVGDHVQKDIEGALAVGAKAVWIAEESSETPPQGALCFKTMYDFLTWLKQ